MTRKQIIILGAILAALAAALLVKAAVRALTSDDRVREVPSLAWTSAGVDRIQIGRGDAAPSVELAKENGVWKVKSLWDAKADAARVDGLLGTLGRAMQEAEFRGSGKALFPDFGITDAEALFLKFTKSGQTDLDLRLGMKAAGNGYFVRKAGSEDVYFIDADMAGLLGLFDDLKDAKLSGDVWADLALFRFDPEKVNRITVYRLKGEEKTMAAALERETDPKDPLKSSWKFLRKEMTLAPDPDKILKFIAAMNSVRAQKVADPAGKDYGLENPVWQLAVTDGNDKVILNAGPKAAKEDLYYVKTADAGTVFGLGAGYFDDLNVDDTRFVKDPPLPEPLPEKKK